MNKAKLSLIGILIIVICFSATLAAFAGLQNYPKDGKFKQIPASIDYWSFVDNDNWYMKAPDKFQHMMGWDGGRLTRNFQFPCIELNLSS
jgi:hypothetical protein